MLDLKSLPAEGRGAEQVISPLTASFPHLQKKQLPTLSTSEGCSNHHAKLHRKYCGAAGSLGMYILQSPEQGSYAVHFRQTACHQTLVQLFSGFVASDKLHTFWVI